MINKKTLFKNISLFLCLVPMLVLSLFCLVPKKELKNVSAADVSVNNFTFIGSNLITTTTSHVGSTINAWHILNFNITISMVDGVYSVSVHGYTMGRGTATNNYGNLYEISGSVSNVLDSSVYVNTAFLNSYFVTATTHYVRFNVYRYGSFNGDVYRVVLNSVVDNTAGDVVNTVTYYDRNDNYFLIEIPTAFGASYNALSAIEAFKFGYRQYYVNLDISNNTYYETGYTDGYNAGLSDGEDTGYQDGYNAGETIGYQNGYNAGVEHGGNYSFMGLIGAVIDAPVSAFTSLLNFELLGVNILGFISGLLTLALIIFIIKLCMGGK